MTSAHSFATKLRRWRPGAYARDSVRVLGWLSLRAAAQAISVLLLARWLGASGYGVFVSAMAVAGFFTPLAGLGVGAALLVRGSRQPDELPALQHMSIRIWRASAAFCVLLAVVAMAWSLPERLPVWALVALASAEVAAGSWVELKARIAQAHLQMHRFGALQAGLPAARLAALAAAMLFAPATPTAWMLVYALASGLYAAFVANWEGCNDHKNPLSLRKGCSLPLLREGLPYAGGAVAMRMQAEFNKPVLAQIAFAESGALNVAQRIVDLVMLPLSVLQEALWPRVLSETPSSARFRKMAVWLIVLAMGGGGLLALAAPAIPWLLGPGYHNATEALLWMAGLPAVQLLRNLGNMAILTRHHSNRLFFVYATSALSSVALALILVPRYGLVGAIWAMYASEGIAAATAWLCSTHVLCRLGRHVQADDLIHPGKFRSHE